MASSPGMIGVSLRRVDAGTGILLLPDIWQTMRSDKQCVAAIAVGGFDPGNLLRRWAPCVQAHERGQGQLPYGSVRPREFLLQTHRAATQFVI